MDDRAALHRLQDYHARHRVLPSYAVIGELVGLRSKASVAALVGRLKSAGYLDSVAGRLKPGPRFFERPLAGDRIAAGLPSPAEAGFAEHLTLDDYLVERPSDTLLVRVEGDSMIEAGIHAGDLAVVERRRDAQPGAIVAAVVDGGYTLKFLERDADGYWLRPANPAYPALRPQGTLEIVGVLVGLVRKYRR